MLATAGYRFYENRRLAAEQAAGAAFQQALALDRDGKGAEADAALAKLAADAPRGYRTLARLAEAAIKAKSDPKGALAAYDALAADASIGPLFQDAARLRAALLRLDAGEADAAKPALEALAGSRPAPIATPRASRWASSRWTRAITTGAGKWLDLVVADPEAPDSGKAQRREPARARRRQPAPAK